MMMQTGLLDWQLRFKQLDNGGDPLPKIQKVVDWVLFQAPPGSREGQRAQIQCRPKTL